MTQTSDSKFFFNDCSCVKKEITSEFFIECNACIENWGNLQNGCLCSCTYHKVRQLNCPTCSEDRDRLDDMHIKFDKLLINLSTTVKSYNSCDNDIHMIIELSKQMRQCNRRLLSRIDTIVEDNSHEDTIRDTFDENSEAISDSD